MSRTHSLHTPIQTTKLAITGLFLGLLIIAGCGENASGSEPANQHLIVTGSSTIAPVLAEIAKRYEAHHPNTRIDIQAGGSSRGIADTKRSLADIGATSRPLHPSEAAGLSQHTFAMDGICFLVHRDNIVPNLTEEQWLSIYTGKIKNWARLGGPDAPITVISRASGRSEVDLLCDYFHIKNDQLTPNLIAGGNEQGIKMLVSDPHAVIYMSIGTSLHHRKLGTAIRLMPLRGIQPTTDTIRSGAYPILRPLVLVTRTHPTQTAVDFVNFARSPKSHDLIEAFQFVPIQN